MVTVRLERTISCTPDELLEFVMDIERYAAVDKKIHPVTWSRREGNLLEFACKPTLAGIPQPKVVQQIRLTPGKRLDIWMSPPPHNRLQHAVARFEASFETEPVDGGTMVTRTLSFRFAAAVRPLAEPLFRRRLPAEVADELDRAQDYLEGTNRFAC